MAQWRARQPGWNIEVCFIEFAPPSLHDGLLHAARNARRVLVLPLYPQYSATTTASADREAVDQVVLLLLGEVSKQSLGLAVTLGPPLGSDVDQ